MPQAQLVSFQYKQGSDYLHIHAIVDDAIQVLPGGRFDPPEFGPAMCETVLVLDDPITADNAPTNEDVERMLPWINDWSVIPPIEFDEYGD